MFTLLKTLSFFFLISSSAFAECNWIELPEGDYREIILEDSPNCIHLNHLIKSYHEEPKDCPIAITIRIAKLADIHIFLKDWIQKDPSNPRVRKLLKHVNNKCRYLSAIMRLYLQGNAHPDNLKDYHLSTLDNAVCMTNDVNYSLTEKQYVGAFWMESIDPCHRVLGNYYQKWLVQRDSNKASPWFFLWLETQNVPANTPVITYLDETGLAEAELESHDILYDGVYLCVVNENKTVYLNKQKPGLYFSSFSKGKPVFGACYLHCENGKVTKIVFDHQRYQPKTPEQYQQLISYLYNKNIPFNPQITVQYFQDQVKYEIAIHSAIMENGEIFNVNKKFVIIDP